MDYSSGSHWTLFNNLFLQADGKGMPAMRPFIEDDAYFKIPGQRKEIIYLRVLRLSRNCGQDAGSFALKEKVAAKNKCPILE